MFAYTNAVIIYQVPKQKNQGGTLFQDCAGSANTASQSSTALHLLQPSVTTKRKQQAQSMCKDPLFQKGSIWPLLCLADDGYAESEALYKQVKLWPLV